MKKFIKTFIAQTLCVVQKFIKWIDAIFLVRKSANSDKIDEARTYRNRFFLATLVMLTAVLLISFLARNTNNGFLRFGVICIENFAGFPFLYFLFWYLLYDSNVSEEKFTEWLWFNDYNYKSVTERKEYKKLWRSEHSLLCMGNYLKVVFWILVLIATSTYTHLLISVFIFICAGTLFMYLMYRVTYFDNQQQSI